MNCFYRTSTENLSKHFFKVIAKCSLRSCLSLLFLFLFSVLGSTSLWSQCTPCPEIEGIFVDGCSSIGSVELDEYVVISTGGGFNTGDLEFDISNNNGTDNGDISEISGPCGLTFGSAGMISGCPNVIPVGPGFDLPPNSLLILQVSGNAASATPLDFSAMCGLGECVYVIQNTCIRTSAAFANGSGSGTRTNSLSINGCPCTDDLTYERNLLVGSNGAYVLDGGVYGNDACDAPAIPGTIIPPNLDDLPDQNLCASSYTLPAITGTNLTGNERYYTGPNGTGTVFVAGQSISTTTTLYIFDASVGCVEEEEVTITLQTPTVPNLDPLGPFCESDGPVALNTTQDGFAGMWSGPGVSGNTFNPSTAGTGSQTLTFMPTGSCVQANTIDVTVISAPTANPAGPLSACDEGANQASFDLTSLDFTIGNGSIVNWYTNAAATSPILNTTNYQSGNTTVFATVSAGTCVSASVPITLNVTSSLTINPLSTVCSSDNSTYEFSFTISGGTGPYTVTGGLGGNVSGNTFTSNPIPSGDSYNFTISDASGCPIVVENGSFDCCITFAGTMNLSPLSACTDGTVSPIHNNDEVLDPNDILVFVLHDGTLNDLTDVIDFDLSQNPTFSFNPLSMTAGVTYFVSAVAGGTETFPFNINDLCLSVSQGTPVSFVAPPNINDLPDQSTCTSYTLPGISGTNLSGNEAYYTQSGGTGTQFNPGQVISANTTLFIYDASAVNCDDEESFTITITGPPALQAVADETNCGPYTLPNIQGTNLSGNQAYYTQPGGNGIQLNPGQQVPATTTLFIYDGTTGCEDEESFMITITDPPALQNGGNQLGCGSYTLPTIQGTNLTGNQAYYTGANGTGTQFNEGQSITASTTLFIFDGVLGCSDETTIDITILDEPQLQAVAPVTACGSYSLPTIQGTNLTGGEAYYTGPGGSGTQLPVGQAITGSTLLFIYDGAPGCEDEEQLIITITAEPQLQNIPDATACGSFLLPNIPGTNLTGNQAYYTGPNGTGTQFNIGEVINISSNLFIYDGTPGCDDQLTFNVTINQEPQPQSPGDQTLCGGYILPAINGFNLTGNEAYYTGPGGTGTQFQPGAIITNSINLFIYDGIPGCEGEVSFSINITAQPQINPIADVNNCGNYILPAIQGIGLSGNQAYYTGSNGTGTQLLPGQPINNSVSLFAYDGIPGCEDQQSFNITISSQPQIDPITDVSNCGDYILPAIEGAGLTGGQAYYTGPNGTGAQFFPGQPINSSVNLFAYDGTPGCDDEQAFAITITAQPQIDLITDVTNCGDYLLPAIEGANLSGNQAYYSGPNGTGTQFLPGQSINNSINLFAYDGAPGCDDEQAFAITITAQPQIELIL